MVLLLITMYFSGGLIPTYLVVSKLHMINSFWALILPEALPMFCVLITMNFSGDFQRQLRRRR